MSIYKEFSDLYPYIQSIRKLKNYLSFDMNFPKDWKLPKKFIPENNVVENESQDPNRRLISFVSEFEEEKVDSITASIKNIVKYNKELEEKERLFNSKVKELKTIFEKQNLTTLKDLKFDLESEKFKLEEDDEDEQDTNRKGKESPMVEE
jgi:hypothetical protein